MGLSVCGVSSIMEHAVNVVTMIMIQSRYVTRPKSL